MYNQWERGTRRQGDWGVSCQRAATRRSNELWKREKKPSYGRGNGSRSHGQVFPRLPGPRIADRTFVVPCKWHMREKCSQKEKDYIEKMEVGGCGEGGTSVDS